MLLGHMQREEREAGPAEICLRQRRPLSAENLEGSQRKGGPSISEKAAFEAFPSTSFSFLPCLPSVEVSDRIEELGGLISR